MTVSAGGAIRTTSDALDFDSGDNNLVERVKVTNSRGHGIVFDGKNAGFTAEHNVVRNCVITGPMPLDGVQFLGSSNNTIEGCTISGVVRHGIYADKASSTAAQPNKPSNNNVIRNNIVQSVGNNGIRIHGSNGNQITGNTVTNSAGNEIGIATTSPNECDDNVVQSNTLTNNTRYGLEISSSTCDRTVVGGNTFSGNGLGAIRDVGTGTIYTSPVPDTTPPTAPSGLVASNIQSTQVTLNWTASTDNVGVTNYIIRNGGAAMATVGAVTSHTLTGLTPSTTYQFTVVARDAANNTSGPSNLVPVTTSSGAPVGGTLTLNPVADSYVNGDSASQGTNYGNSTSLRTDASPINRSYLRFTVPALSGSVTSATLRVFASSANTLGYTVHPTDGTWGETTINFSNAPGFGASLGSSGAVTASTWTQVNVTSFVTGAGECYNFVMASSSSTATSFASRQSSTNKPELIVVVSGSPAAPTITSAAPGGGTVGVAYNHTYTASGSPTITYTRTAGTLPPGLTLTTAGVLSGTPTTAGTYTGTVTASNGTAPNSQQNFSITIAPALVAPTITSAAPAGGIVGIAYSHTYTATGSPTITYTRTAGTLPPGLTLTTAGVLSGTPTTAGTYTGTVTASNGVAPNSQQNFSITIAPAPVAPTITSAAPGDGIVGLAYSHTYTATGSPTITYTATGTLPTGVDANDSRCPERDTDDGRDIHRDSDGQQWGCAE